MQAQPLVEQLIELTHSSDKKAIREIFAQYHHADFADIVNVMPVTEAHQLILMLPLQGQSDLFHYIEAEHQAAIARLMTRNELAALFSSMESDERADLFNRLSKEQQYSVLPGLAQVEREDIRLLASYPEETAGAIMTSDYATLREDWTVKHALKRLRLEAPDKETIYQTYVIDEQRQLLGIVSLRELILASPDTSIADLMRKEVIAAKVDDDQEQVASTIQHYDLLALPVLDAEFKLVGIVTYDDAMDAAQAEATEDAQKSASVAVLQHPLNKIGFIELYKKRIGWLVLLVFGSLLSGAGIAIFEDVIAAHVALVFFMPLLVGSGGNAGSQSAALMVRALATGEVLLKDWAKVLGRECLVAAALGLTMGITVFALGLFRGGAEIAAVVSLAMLSVVIIGSLIGLCLPFLLSRLKLDPATASGPLVTTIVDACGVLIYFGFASSLLNLV